MTHRREIGRRAAQRASGDRRVVVAPQTVSYVVEFLPFTVSAPARDGVTEMHFRKRDRTSAENTAAALARLGYSTSIQPTER